MPATPYTLKVEPHPRTIGVWSWAIRYHGKLIERSDRGHKSEAQARANGAEVIETLIHRVDDGRR